MPFDWDDANILHLARHDITPDEAEQVVENDPVDLDMRHVWHEWRLQQVGETHTGRLLTIVSTERSGMTRVISGWDPTKADKSVYLGYRMDQIWKPS
jgi:uncharacterized DUF497 family protein